MSEKRRVLCVLGTRPEVIKFAPVIRALRRYDGIVTKICSTGQHDQILQDALKERGIAEMIDYQRAVLLPGAPLDVLASRLLSALNGVMIDAWPDLVLVQGDTTTALCGALSAFHHGIAVGHVEAGLRTSNPAEPFPEEMNRRLISRIARLHFCPTTRALDALLHEGHNDGVFMTGNTIVDELKAIINDPVAFAPGDVSVRRIVGDASYVLVTCHRRERLRERLDLLIAAVIKIVAETDLSILWPVHPNPAITMAIERRLIGRPRIHVIPPLSYSEFVAAVWRADVVVTDSGGTIEEATTLCRLLFIIRDETERSEALDRGARLVPMIDMPKLGDLVADSVPRPAGLDETFGDGLAGERIASIIGAWLHTS